MNDVDKKRIERLIIQHRAESLVHDARSLGLVVEINLVSNWPPRTGDYKEVISIREERKFAD